MNSEIKQLWIDALLSGEYEQGQHELRTVDNKFCCLGVLADIVKDKLEIGAWEGDHYHGYKFVVDHDIRSGALHHGVIDRIGLTEDLQRTLIGFNDNGKSFKQIASYIQENA